MVMETVLVLLIVIAAAAYAARALLPQGWLPRWLRRARSPADGCSNCGPGPVRRPTDAPPRRGS
jgi:hypothetical protein